MATINERDTVGTTGGNATTATKIINLSTWTPHSLKTKTSKNLDKDLDDLISLTTSMKIERKLTKEVLLLSCLQNLLDYIKINEILDIEGRPIVAGSAYYTHGISTLIHKIMEPSLIDT